LGSVFAFDEFELDVDRRELWRAGVATKADGLLLRLLEVFVRNPGQLITKHELVSRVWQGRAVSENALTVAITRLRKTLTHERGVRDMVLTVHGEGYRFLPAVVTRELRPAPSTAELGVAPNLAPFVGRERVMEHLRSALMEARSGSGSGGGIVLTGEPGIGKTRVAEMLAREASAANVPVAWAYCRELGDTPPLWPFAGLLRDVLARPLRDAISQDPRFLELIPELARLLPELPSTDTKPRRETTEPFIKLASKHRVFDAVTRALALAAEHTPYLLIVDDLHRADAASLELLHYFLAELPRMRILLLATARSESDSTDELPLRRVLNHRNCTRVALQPLSEAQVASYVVALFGNVDKALCQAVFEKSEGNPLFMNELARQLRKGAQPDIARLTTPSVALELIRQRVAGLDDAALSALTCAAVIGRSFGLPLLQAIMDRDAADLMSDLDQAIAREILMPARDSPTEFTFTHELLRAALYETLDPAQRRAWHVRVAQALDARMAHGDVLAADLAYHARAALPEGDLRKAVDHCVEASNAAARVYAYQDAARYLQHARQALDLIEGASPRLRFGLLWRQAHYVRGYSVYEFLPLAEQLRHLARESGSGVAMAHAAMLLDSFPGFPRLPGARAALAESLARLPEDAHCIRATLQVQLAKSAPLAQRTAESDRQLERSLELARNSHQLEERMTARFAELYLYGGPARDPRAAEAMRNLQELCNQNASTFTLPSVLLDLHRALTAAQEGDLGSVTRALERSEARCRDFDIELLWHIERFRAIARINVGHAAEGRASLLQLHQRAISAGPIVGTELFCAYDRSVIFAGSELRSERWERALAPDPEDSPNIWAMKVRALSAVGAIDEARSALTSLPAATLTHLGCDREYLGTLGALARAALTLEAHDYARVLYELLSPYPEHFAVNLAFLCEGSVSQLLGMLARSFGETARARRHLETAIAASEQAGLTACAAEARLEHKLC
jgi:DNA-binding winged helix-turn-helix (wHTH) protein